MEIDPKKMTLINEFAQMAKGRSSEEILPLVMAVSQKAKQMGLSFTKEETVYIIDQLKENLSESDRSKLDMFVKLML